MSTLVISIYGERHSEHVYKNYWITAEDEIIKLDRPSKFHPDIAPIHYTKIADVIFSPENRNVTKNHRPVFDKSTGLYVHKDSPLEKLHLLTYKDTRMCIQCIRIRKSTI